MLKIVPWATIRHFTISRNLLADFAAACRICSLSEINSKTLPIILLRRESGDAEGALGNNAEEPKPFLYRGDWLMSPLRNVQLSWEVIGREYRGFVQFNGFMQSVDRSAETAASR